MASESLKIRMIGGHGRSYIKLEGTVLILNQKAWFSESKIMIPIESISISEHPRFYKDLLILVVIIPLLVLSVLTYMYFQEEIDTSEIRGMLFPVIGVIVFLEFWMLFALVFNFLFTKKTVCLAYFSDNPEVDSEDVVEADFKIEFWKKRKNAKQIDVFLEQIRQKQREITDNLDNESGNFFEIRNVSPIGRLIGLWLLFCIPSLLFEKPILLLLSLIPIAWYFYSSFQLMRQPKEFRKALRNLRHKQGDQAIELLLQLHEQEPDYIPAIYLLIDAYISAERFDEAQSFVSEIPDDYFQDVNAVHLNIWKWKRIHMRRIDSK